jgi:hypothetical protein
LKEYWISLLKSAIKKGLVFSVCFIGHEVIGQIKEAKILLSESAKGLEHLFTIPQAYTVSHTQNPPEIDGDITDTAWSKAAWSANFADIEGAKRADPYLNTQVKMLWDDKYLYVAANLDEPHVWANLKIHDQVVFHDNDFEIFLDPDNDGHQYFEIEVNAFNTIFDLFLTKPYRNNSGALISWDAKGLKSAVKVHGTLNSASDKDRGWTVEFAIPFSAVSVGNITRVPKDGSLWRINFSRVHWDTEVIGGKYIKKKDRQGKVLPEHNWVWSSQGVINMHLPERWGYLQFTKDTGRISSGFSFPYREKQKQFLWLVYYRQQEYRNKHKRFASALTELGISDSRFQVDQIQNQLKLEATGRQFTITISDEKKGMISLNNEGLIENLSNYEH